MNCQLTDPARPPDKDFLQKEEKWGRIETFSEWEGMREGIKIKQYPLFITINGSKIKLYHISENILGDQIIGVCHMNSSSVMKVRGREWEYSVIIDLMKQYHLRVDLQ